MQIYRETRHQLQVTAILSAALLVAPVTAWASDTPKIASVLQPFVDHHELAGKPEHNALFDDLSAKLKAYQQKTCDPWISKYEYE